MQLEKPQLPTAPGAWPSDPRCLPIFLNERELAHLLAKTVRTLQRYRREGTAIRFRRAGRTVLYAREDVLDFVQAKDAALSQP